MEEKYFKKYCVLSRIGDCVAGMTPAQARNYINRMKLDPEYSHGVACPTQKTTIINVDIFYEFMLKMDERKFK